MYTCNRESVPRLPDFSPFTLMKIPKKFSFLNSIAQIYSVYNIKRAYSLVNDILRAANVFGALSGLWKEREIKRTYRNPRGVGRDENQRSKLLQPTTEKK